MWYLACTKRLPEVFTPEEAMTVVTHLEGKYWMLGMLQYGAGLRLIESLRLRVKDIRIVQELLGHDDVETTQIYTHVLAKRLQNVRSPADMFGKNGFMKCNLNLSDLPPALEKRFRQVVQNHYKGDMQTALAAFLDLHDKHGAALKTS